jgi:hypothetical protein
MNRVQEPGDSAPTCPAFCKPGFATTRVCTGCVCGLYSSAIIARLAAYCAAPLFALEMTNLPPAFISGVHRNCCLRLARLLAGGGGQFAGSTSRGFVSTRFVSLFNKTVGKLKRKRPLGRPTQWWVYCISIDLRERG